MICSNNIYVCLDSDFNLIINGISKTSSILITNNNSNISQFFFNYNAFKKVQKNIHFFNYNAINDKIIVNNVILNNTDIDSLFVISVRNNSNAQEKNYIINNFSCKE